VRIHPDGGLYAGDLVSFEVNYAPLDGTEFKQLNLSRHPVQVIVDTPSGANEPAEKNIPTVEFVPGPDPGSYLATFLWTWDTHGLAAGQHTLTFTLPQDQISWTQPVEIHPADEVPPPEPASHWATAQTACCTISYLTGTPSERDLAQIETIANKEAQSVQSELNTHLKSPIRITLLPRVLGQGGFTSNEIEVSYLDRDYAGSTLAIVLHHEMVHWVDGQLGGDLRPTLLLEGLSVYLTGGHFKPEPVTLETSALLSMGQYIPLASLADNFYASQHEIGYLEGAALVDYLVKTWGWDAFNSFYRDIHPIRGQGQSASIDAALRSHFGLSLAAVEDRFIQYLQTQAFPSDLPEDVSLTVRYYDTVREYQQLLDPSAYFRQVWLPNVEDMRKRGITADLLRHPDAPINREIETMLVQVDKSLRAGDFPTAETVLTQAQLQLRTVTQSSGTALKSTPNLEASRRVAVLEPDSRLTIPVCVLSLQ
jgi:hypothetical protein